MNVYPRLTRECPSVRSSTCFWSFVLTVLLALLTFSGCAESQLSSSDRLAVQHARSFNLLLSPALVETRSPRLQTYLNQVAARLIATAKEDGSRADSSLSSPPGWLTAGDFHLHLVADALPNAFTLSGSHVYASSELLAKCMTEDDLVAAFCHALAHAYATRTLAEPATADTVIRDVISLSRPASTDVNVDRIGFDLYCRSGWEPRRYAALVVAASGSSATDLPRAAPQSIAVLVDKLPRHADEWRQAPVADNRRFAALKREAAALATGIPQRGQATSLIHAMPNCFLPSLPTEQARARAELIPPPATEENPWGKGPRPKPVP